MPIKQFLGLKISLGQYFSARKTIVISDFGFSRFRAHCDVIDAKRLLRNGNTSVNCIKTL